MANATLDWSVTPRFNLFLTMEMRSDRYRGVDAFDRHLFYKDYEVFHLGASYQINEFITVNARVNNLLDEDFTSYTTTYQDLNGDGVYEYRTGRGAVSEVVFDDDYNHKDKARNLWLSVNVAF